MRLRPLMLAAGSAVVLFLAVIAALRVSGAALIQEAGLPGPSQALYEINHGLDDRFYVSGDKDLWQIDPSAGMVYTRFHTADFVVDAKPDRQNKVWWTDFDRKLYRLDLSTQSWQAFSITTTLPDFLGGLAFDRDGNIWLTTNQGDKVFRFRPSDGQLCRYTLPGGVESTYIAVEGDNIWLANWIGISIIRFNPGTLQVTSWSVKEGASQVLQGPAIGWDGRLWWAELTDTIGSLDPVSGELRRYQLPAGTGDRIEMVDPRGAQVWYTEDVSGTLGVLDPSKAITTTTTVTPTTGTATAGSCNFPTPSTPAKVIPSTGSLSWSPALTTTLPATGPVPGWTIYQVGQNAEPYGLDAGGGYQWATDWGRHKLLRLPVPRAGQLKVAVSPNPSQAFHGQDVIYTYSVTYRSGDDSPARNISVAGEKCSPASGPGGGDENADELLDVYETWTYTCQYKVPPHSEGEATTFTNMATVSGKDMDGVPAAAISGTATVTLRHRLGTLSVTNSGPATAKHGQKATFSYTVGYASPDNLPAQAIDLSDDLCPDPTLLGGDLDGDQWLDVSETWSYRCQVTIPAHSEDEGDPLVNIATATGQNYDGTALAAKTAGHPTTVEHALGNLKLAISGPPSAKHGQTILFGYNITYSSSDGASAKAIGLTDTICSKRNFVGGDADGDNRLDVDENWLYSCSYAVSAHVEGEANPMINKATVTGQNFNGRALTAATAQHAIRIFEKLFLPLAQRQ